jgi:hypothetical protein
MRLSFVRRASVVRAMYNFAFGGVASPPVFLRSNKKLLLDKAPFVTIVELGVWTCEVILDGIE